jgi:5-oxoprolinase (ATP-hydrolysing)
VYFEHVGRVDDAPVYLLEKLDLGDMVQGPAMIVDGTQTIVVVPGTEAIALSQHLVIKVDTGE